MICTHMREVGVSFAPEVPIDGGSSHHLGPPLAGDAAQFESHTRHCLCVGVHLGTGPPALVQG